VQFNTTINRPQCYGTQKKEQTPVLWSTQKTQLFLLDNHNNHSVFQLY